MQRFYSSKCVLCKQQVHLLTLCSPSAAWKAYVIKSERRAKFTLTAHHPLEKLNGLRIQPKEEPVRGLSRGSMWLDYYSSRVPTKAFWKATLVYWNIHLRAERGVLVRRKSNHGLEHFSNTDTNNIQAKDRNQNRGKCSTFSTVISAELLIKCEENRKSLIYCLRLPICAQEM